MSARPAVAAFAILVAALTANGLRVVDPKLHHLRIGPQREWAEFAEKAEGGELSLSFDGQANPSEQTLLLRHRDVKQTWKVTLNGRELGRLPADENDMLSQWAVPPACSPTGKNTLLIAGAGKEPDDIAVGEIRIEPRSPAQRLAEARVEVAVTDEHGQGLPCRLTLVDASGSLPPIGAKSDSRLAVRPGVVYTADGRAEFGLPAGKYTLYAGRGFEYSLARVDFELKNGDVARHALQLRREVPTPGWVSCDTHIHTLTYSGHGDATLDERMLSIAGEGIELAIATDHNVHVDYEPAAQKTGTRKFFTPVMGNEVTTKAGHFNAFPIRPEAAVVDGKISDWTRLLPAIRNTPGVEVVVLNHPRNLHSGYQPFGAVHYNAIAGENLDGWPLDFDAVEVVTSAALQSDIGLLYRDWFGLLNRGFKVSPVGSSDAHDVNRYILGQGRTYIACPDDDPARLDVAAAAKSLREGRVMVSMGLLTEIQVDERHGPGDLVTAGEQIRVKCRVLGPHWITADHVALYANGILIEETRIAREKNAAGGLQWQGVWTLPRPKHDLYLVALATGPGVQEPYWRIPKPYQPTQLDWTPRVIGSTAPVWIDANADGRHASPREYAQRALTSAGDDFPRLLMALSDFDEAIASQAAYLWQSAGHSLLDPSVSDPLKTAPAAVRRGFAAYLKAWKECEQARVK